MDKRKVYEVDVLTPRGTQATQRVVAYSTDEAIRAIPEPSKGFEAREVEPMPGELYG